MGHLHAGRARRGLALFALILAAQAILLAFGFLLPPRFSLADQLRLHDLRVEGILSQVGGADPNQTVLVGDAYNVGSYRLAGYYLPGYHRVGLGRDTRGRVREIFGDAYDPAGGRRSSPLAFSPEITTYVYLDRELLPLIADRDRLTSVTLLDGSAVFIWRGHPPEVIANQLWIDRHRQPGSAASAY